MPRLLHVETRQFEEFNGDIIPPYAILSHTWGPNELTFKDVQGLGAPGNFPKDSKIDGCCARALQDGYDYVWIDTICIDKSSSAELSEAINSMFDWYFNAGVCYAYLSDVHPGEDPLDRNLSFSKSRWFTRGWTLQELLAPETVLFFDRDWSCIGRKQLGPGGRTSPRSETISRDPVGYDAEFIELLAQITKIPSTVLRSRQAREDKFQGQTIAEKMSWACRRQVTRKEDEAYSLLGLFQINMPLLYGEGDKAFQRLQEELIRTSDDETIFAWGFGRSTHSTGRDRGGLLASSLLDFELPNGLAIVRLPGTSKGIRSGHYQVTNKGILLRKPLRAASLRAYQVPLHLVPLMCEVTQRVYNDEPSVSSSPDLSITRSNIFNWDRSMRLAILVRSPTRDRETYHRAMAEPISVSSRVFFGKKIKEFYVSEARGPDGSSVHVPTRIFHINRPHISNDWQAGLGIRLNAFYPPDMQVVNPHGHNSLLVHCHTLAKPGEEDRKLWAGWRQKLWPEMRNKVYFVHFNGSLGSFVVMVFPVDGDHELPFLPRGGNSRDG